MASLGVISLSSSSSDASPSELSVVSVSSESQRRGCGKRKAPIDPLEQTPSHTEKVQEWISSLRNVGTCARYDFDKAKRAPKTAKSCYSRSTPFSSYLAEARKRNVPTPRAKSVDRAKINGNLHRSPRLSTPLSPETHKRELCSYLQLMKPNDQRSEFFIEHRRSGRVKTMTQKKQAEGAVKEAPDIHTLQSLEKLNTKISKLQRLLENTSKRFSNKYMPLPPECVYSKIEDFDDCIAKIVDENRANGSLGKSLVKRRKLKVTRGLRLKTKGSIKSLQLKDTCASRGSSVDHLILQQEAPNTFQNNVEESTEKVHGCEIVVVPPTSDDENVDLQNFVDDMLQLDNMSEEHRKSVIESRILASTSLTNLIHKKSPQQKDVQRAYKIFFDLSNERKNPEEKENTRDENVEGLATDVIGCEHDYASRKTQKGQAQEELKDAPVACEEPVEETNSLGATLSPVPISDLPVVPLNTNVQIKSLHRSLSTVRHKLHARNYWSSSSTKSEEKRLNHSISISRKNGVMIKAVYQDFNLVVVQKKAVSFWTQSALGNVLGAQNMWIPKGQEQRIPLNSTYIAKDALETVISTETSVAYVELWTKEHKSEIREVPVADVFATVYFWRVRQSGLDKKSLQLENIKGRAVDVQYCVLRYFPKIIVSWRWMHENEQKTKINSFHLAADFQTVASINEMQPVDHHVVSLHNIEDCENLVMGSGENKLTLWNVEHGYVVATVELLKVNLPLSTLWVKCDRGFLFTVQECVDQQLSLIAINGMNHSWKKLQNYTPPSGFSHLKGVCLESGVLIAYYRQGILCWNAQTGDMIVEVPEECEYVPSGKHVITTVRDKIVVKHSLTHLTAAVDEF